MLEYVIAIGGSTARETVMKMRFHYDAHCALCGVDVLDGGETDKRVRPGTDFRPLIGEEINNETGTEEKSNED